MALLAVTDAYGKGPDHAERMRGCARVIQLMLRTWSGKQLWVMMLEIAYPCQGLMYFCMNHMLAIRSIVDTLRIPSLETRVINFCDLTRHNPLTPTTGNYSRYVFRPPEY